MIAVVVMIVVVVLVVRIVFVVVVVIVVPILSFPAPLRFGKETFPPHCIFISNSS